MGTKGSENHEGATSSDREFGSQNDGEDTSLGISYSHRRTEEQYMYEALGREANTLRLVIEALEFYGVLVRAVVAPDQTAYYRRRVLRLIRLNRKRFLRRMLAWNKRTTITVAEVKHWSRLLDGESFWYPMQDDEQFYMASDDFSTF